MQIQVYTKNDQIENNAQICPYYKDFFNQFDTMYPGNGQQEIVFVHLSAFAHL